jgi:alpha-glucosidase
LVTRVGREAARLLIMLQLTLRGLPVIYYGDELGLPDGVVAASEIRDPLEHRLSGYGLGRDPARSPMPWSNGPKAGFTTGKPWLPIHQSADSLQVDLQEQKPDSMLQFVRHMIHLRGHSPALIEGDYHSLTLANTDVYAYVRETEYQRDVVVLNFDSHQQEIKLRGPIGAWVAGTHQTEGDGMIPERGEIRLRPYEGRVYELRKKENVA